jgi:hypothetical protein
VTCFQAGKDREELMALFVERGADVNERTKSGGQRTCLHILAVSPSASVEALQFLLDKGADARQLSVTHTRHTTHDTRHTRHTTHDDTRHT